MSEKFQSGSKLKGSSIIHAIKSAKIRTVVALPDIVTCESVLWPISKDNQLRLVQVCKEDEGVAICAALSYCEHRSVLLIQHTGFLYSMNAIRAVAVEYQLPVVMLVGLQGMEPNKLLSESAQIGIRALEPICAALELNYVVLSSESEVGIVESRIEQAYEHSSPVAIFVASSPE